MSEEHEKLRESLVLPVGTQVVTVVELRDQEGNSIRRQGSVGKIIVAPESNKHAYQILFPDGESATMYRAEIAIRKHLQNLHFDRPDAEPGDRDLFQYIIYRCVVGSRAFGLDVDSSDIDRRGIYLPPTRMQWSLYGIPEQIENDVNQECYWELQKFIILSLKANPNVLECLYTPLIEYQDPLITELLENREKFLSKLVYQTYNGYVISQFRKLEQDLRTIGKLKWKHVMHLVRLLLSGITILKEGAVPVKVGDHREKFMAIRNGELAWEEVNEWRLKLHKDFDEAFEKTHLPERPNYEWSNEFLIKARKSRVE